MPDKRRRLVKWTAAFLGCAILLWASGVTQQAYSTIQNNGSSLPQEPTLNFVNAGCVDNAGSHRTDCTFGAVFSQTQSVANAVQTTETTLVGTGSGTNVLPANFYHAGTVLRYHASGFYSTTASPGTLTVKMKHSGGVTSTVTVGSTGAITPLASITNGAWRLWGEITCRTTGTGGTLIVNTIFEGEPSSLSTLTPADASIVNTATVTVDTTAAQTVDLTTAWSASGQTITMTNFVLDSPNTSSTSAASGPTTNQNIRAVSFIFDGAGSALSGTLSRCQQVNYAGTIQEASLIADQSGSVTVDVRTVAFGSYTGPGSASSITASDTPALSSAARFQDSTLTGWTTSLSANTVVCFVMSSPATVTWVAGNIKIAAN